jgi:hypothetical protein
VGKPGIYIRKPMKSIGRGFSANHHLKKIKKLFPNLTIVKEKGTSFIVIIKIQPSPLSKSYDVKISYDKRLGVKVYVINDKLQLAKNRTKLPHVYSHEEQRLCLYSPSKNEWTREKLISSTIIPWAAEWLQYYELWLANGKWLGGGHNEYREDE